MPIPVPIIVEKYLLFSEMKAISFIETEESPDTD
jgi:hypothetical protein